MNDTLKTLQDSLHQTVTDTASLNNVTFDPSRIVENDGLLITVVGYVVVFLALLFLFVIFSNVAKFLIARQKKRAEATSGGKEFTRDELTVSGEVNAAIALALHLHFEEIHDFENTVLTIKKVQKAYSPWSSKIYGLREFPKRKWN